MNKERNTKKTRRQFWKGSSKVIGIGKNLRRNLELTSENLLVHPFPVPGKFLPSFIQDPLFFKDSSMCVPIVFCPSSSCIEDFFKFKDSQFLSIRKFVLKLIKWKWISSRSTIPLRFRVHTQSDSWSNILGPPSDLEPQLRKGLTFIQCFDLNCRISFGFWIRSLVFRANLCLTWIPELLILIYNIVIPCWILY